jgi:hypothetical protein
MHHNKSRRYCDRVEKFDKVESEKACIGDLVSTKIKSKTLTLDGVNVTDILGGQTNTGVAGELDEVTCDPNSILGEFTPKYNPETGVAEIVFNAMLETAREIIYSVPPGAEGLQFRLTQGRARLGLPGPSEVRVVGSITFAPWIPSFPDDPSKSKFINYITDLSWNLLCVNKGQIIQGMGNPAVVAVYAQYAYIDKQTGVCKCELLDLGNKQIEPTIDYKPGNSSSSWGEQFTGVKTLDAGIIDLIFENMPNPKATGGVQMLFLAEKQIDILRLNNCNDPENRANTSVTKCQNNCNITVNQTNTVDTSVGRRVPRIGTV